MTIKDVSEITCAGFTLIETLIYIALFGLIAFGAFSSAAIIQESAEQSHSEAVLIEEAAFIGDVLQARIESATTVTIPTVGETRSQLALMHGNTFITLKKESSALIEKRDDETAPLTSNTILITDASFTRKESVENPDHILVSITLKSTDNRVPDSITIHRVAYLTP